MEIGLEESFIEITLRNGVTQIYKRKLSASLLGQLWILLVFSCYWPQDNLNWQKDQSIKDSSIILFWRQKTQWKTAR